MNNFKLLVEIYLFAINIYIDTKNLEIQISRRFVAFSERLLKLEQLSNRQTMDELILT